MCHGYCHHMTNVRGSGTVIASNCVGLLARVLCVGEKYILGIMSLHERVVILEKFAHDIYLYILCGLWFLGGIS